MDEFIDNMKLNYAREQTGVTTSFARLHLYFVIRSRAPATAAPVARINDFLYFPVQVDSSEALKWK